MLYGIQVGELPGVWPHVKADIDAASVTSRGKFTGDDVLSDLQKGDAQLWIWHTDTARAVLITQIVNYDRNKCCSIRIATGHNYPEWASVAIKRIEEWAKAQGCDAMELIARPGWKRILEGYEMTHIHLEKAL